MIEVSNTYSESMNSTIRNSSKLRINVNHPATTYENVSNVNSTFGVTNLLSDTMASFIVEPITDATLGDFTGELNQAILDENISIAHSSGVGLSDWGYISSILASGDETAMPRVGITFSNPVTTRTIVSKYDVIINTTRYTPVNGMIRLTEPISFTSASVVVSDRLAPYGRLHLRNVYFGEQFNFTESDITEANWVKEVDPISRRLPKNTLTFRVIDYDGIFDPMNRNSFYEFLDTNCEVSMQYGYDIGGGTIEWLPLEWYHLTSKPAYANHIAQFNANKVASEMNEIMYQATAQSGTFMTNLGDRFNNIMVNYAIHNVTKADVISQMNTFPCSVPVRNDKIIECIQSIAHATGMSMFFDRYGRVDLKPFPYKPINFILDDRNIIKDSEVLTINPELKQMIVKVYKGTIGDTVTTLNNLPLSLGINNIDYGSPLSIVSGLTTSGFSGTLLRRGYYGQVIDIDSITGECSVSCKPLVITSSNVTINTSDKGDIDIEDNYLITDGDNARKLANEIYIPYLKKRNVFELDYRGNPELEVGDMFTYIDRYGVTHNVVLLSHTILYNGAIRGKMVLKEV